MPTHYVPVTNLPPRLEANGRAELEAVGVIHQTLIADLESAIRNSCPVVNTAALVRDREFRQDRTHADTITPIPPKAKMDVSEKML